MKTKETSSQSLVQKVAQAIVRRELYAWPPDSLWGLYQPHRPAKPLLQPQDKKQANM